MNNVNREVHLSGTSVFRDWFWLLVIGLGLMGLGLSYAAFDSENKHRKARFENDFRLEVSRHLSEVNQGLAEAAEKVASISSFYVGSEVVDAREFRNFTARSLNTGIGFDVLAWAPVEYTGEDWEAGNSALTGLSLPLQFIEPGPQSNLGFGTDLLNIAGMGAMVEATFERGDVQHLLAGDNIFMVSQTLDGTDWSGIAVGVLPLESLEKWIGIDHWDIAIQIANEQTGRILLRSGLDDIKDEAYVSDLTIGTETWRVSAMPLSGHDGPQPAWATLAAGVMITVLLLVLIVALAGSAARAEKIVRMRTRELEQAEAEARGQAIRLADEVTHTGQVISAIPSILVSLDVEGKITQWNRATHELSGIDATDACGRHISECGWCGDTDALAAGVQRCLADKTTVKLENLVFAHANGSEATIGMTIIPIRDSENNMNGCLLIGADITDRNKMEVQLREAQRLEAVGRLAAGIAHEVNTPAQFVSDNTTFLQEAFADLMELETTYSAVISELDAAITDEQKQRIADAQQAADREFLVEEVPQSIEQSMDGIRRIADIVRAMKEFSHPGGGGGKEQADFNRLITNAITVAANEWKYHAEIDTDFDEALPPLPCYPRELNQVVLNLIINAAHAISDSIEEKGTRGKISIKTSCNDGFIQMRLTDTGTGIPEHVRSKIFEPFFTTKEVGRGSGQGLALAYAAVVEQHGGELSFETETGVGTTFIVNLPLQEAHREAVA